jgi:hypothetical protein
VAVKVLHLGYQLLLRHRVPAAGLATTLSDRQVHSPYILHSGDDGTKGPNLFINIVTDSTNHVINLKRNNSIKAATCSRMRILTPGGDAFVAFSEPEAHDTVIDG